MKQVLLVLALAFCFAAVALGNKAATQRTFTAEQFARMRCSTDSDEQSITTWTGSALSFVPGERQKTLFNVVGVNLARCLKTASGYQLVSRELQLYTNATTGAKLRTWTNPWTNEVVPVVHVANDPVNFAFPSSSTYTGYVDGDYVTFPSITPLTYPNPLYGNSSFTPYSPQAMYQADEFFYFSTPLKEVEEDCHDSVSTLRLTWNRISLWLPWMKLGDKAGYLTFTAFGNKVKKIKDLPDILKNEINNRMPLYKNAPPCVLNKPNVSSWTYFRDNFAAYLAGAEFPIPAPANTPQTCA